MRYTYKTILAVCILIVTGYGANAQIRGAWGKRGSFHIFTNTSADFHINSVDVKKDSMATGNVLTSINKVGTRIGVDMVRITRYRMMISMGFDFRFEPQKLRINYSAAEMGFTGPGAGYTYREDRTFTNKTIETKGKIGFSISTGSVSAVDIMLGMTFSASLNGRADTNGVVFHDVSGTGYKEPMFYQKSGWGTQRPEQSVQTDDYRVNVLGQFQVAYRFLQPSVFSDRAIRIGLDVGAMPNTLYNNRAEITTFGPSRQQRGTYKFSDVHFAIGLFLGVEL